MSQPINKRPGRQSCFYDRPKKHHLGRRHWDLVYCQVSLNSFQRFQRRSWKCLSQSETGQSSCFSNRHKKKLGRGRWDLGIVCDFDLLWWWFVLFCLYNKIKASLSCFLSSFVEFRSAFFEEMSKMSLPIRGQGSHLVVPIDPKNTNLVEDVEILLPIKFRWVPFSGFWEVENVSTYYRPERPSYFSDLPEKHKVGRGRWDLASCQVSLNSVQRFQRWSRKCLSQSEAGVAILFSDRTEKTQTL